MCLFPPKLFPLTVGTKASSSWAPLLFTLGLRANSHHVCFSSQELGADPGPSVWTKKRWWKDEVLHKIAIGFLGAILIIFCVCTEEKGKADVEVQLVKCLMEKHEGYLLNNLLVTFS